ncbi:hypothetical protein CBR_g24314 [Chara braunii]|uniref:Uncharacterized protein n=1 Tax=Chara braunii TaxID=69332 RepID=A0A388JMD4_CHABU|nr:hypothetical protein CBR_g24314 [Chara braunii]|eukprot:GBG58964.1 hypothetical protein CBR_g24314 [Chara braunii]
MATGDGLHSWRDTQFYRKLNLFYVGIIWALYLVQSHLMVLWNDFKRNDGCRSPSTDDAACEPKEGDIDAMGHQGQRNEGCSPSYSCIVTGASSGIGKAVAEELAAKGFYVILGCVSPQRGLEAAEEIQRKHKGAAVEVRALDLSSPASVVSFANNIALSLGAAVPPRPLVLLINNAAVIKIKRTWTEEGRDYVMATNYLGSFLLSRELLPLLEKAPRARIVNVCSFTHRAVSALYTDEPSLAAGGVYPVSSSASTAGTYMPGFGYQTTKLCNTLFTNELHRRLFVERRKLQSPVVSANAADPGAVDTNLLREVPVGLRKFGMLVLAALGLLKSPAEGANAVIDAALANEGTSGLYYFGGKGRHLKGSQLACNEELGRNLWETSSRMFHSH